MGDETTRTFLATYNRLDALLRTRMHADAAVSHAKLIEKLSREDAVVAEVASRLHAFRALRNAIVHMGLDGETEPIAAPHAAAVAEYAGIVRLIAQPPRALDWMATCTPFTAQWNMPLRSALATLEEHGWDTLPVVENDRLEGMYTLASLQSWLLDAGSLTLDDTTVQSLRSRIAFVESDPANVHRSVPGVALMPEASTVREVEDAFRASNRPGAYLLAVCLTPTGRYGEPLLGIVTPHNLPSANPEAHARRVQQSLLG